MSNSIYNFYMANLHFDKLTDNKRAILIDLDNPNKLYPHYLTNKIILKRLEMQILLTKPADNQPFKIISKDWVVLFGIIVRNSAENPFGRMAVIGGTLVQLTGDPYYYNFDVPHERGLDLSVKDEKPCCVATKIIEFSPDWRESNLLESAMDAGIAPGIGDLVISIAEKEDGIQFSALMAAYYTTE